MDPKSFLAAFPYGVLMVPAGDGPVRELQIRSVRRGADGALELSAVGRPGVPLDYRFVRPQIDDSQWRVDETSIGHVALRPLSKTVGDRLNASLAQSS